ncbi:MAG: hypothetical protein OHK0046_27430 [Anaerolineae bacterium]
MRKFMIAILVLMLAVFGAAAQDAPAVNCGDLSAEDCGILESSQAAMAEVSSGAFNLTFDLAITGAADATDNMSLGLSADGSFSGVNFFANNQVMNATDMATDLAASLEVLQAGLNNFDGTLNLNLTLPADSGLPLPLGDSLALELALVDGIGYINFDTVSELLGPDAASMGLVGWGGIDLNYILDQFGPMISSMAAGTLDQAAAGVTDPEVLGEFANPEFINSYVSTERAADEGGLAVFLTTIDVAGLVNDPAVREAVVAQAEAQGTTSEDVLSVLDQLAAAGEGFSVTVNQRIDLATSYIDSLDISVFLDASAFQEGETGTLTVNGVISYSDLNNVTVSAPEGANVASPEFLNAMLGSMMGGQSQ